MPTPIHRDQLRELLDRGAQLIEVLPHAECDDEHLEGARNIPLRDLTSERTAGLDRSRPVVVYCWDSL